MDSVPVTKSGRLWKSKADFFRPFRNAATEALEDASLAFDPDCCEPSTSDPNLKELNVALEALADVFPEVEPEVFREMLVSVSDESRLEVVTEHLLQKKAKWVKGRFRVPQKFESSKKTTSKTHVRETPLSEVEHFRNETYKKAVKQVFYQEFKSLSHSSIKAVLAEHNFSYTLSRPVLQQASAISWRSAISNLWSSTKKQPPSSGIGHPSIVWRIDETTDGKAVPAVRRTGDSDLDLELHSLFVIPVLAKQSEQRTLLDFAAASHLNEQEAQAADALFDCECCYSSVTFEQIATCDTNTHVHCLDCVRRTMKEAMYGQGWARTTDLHKCTLRCFASTSQDCGGSLPTAVVRRALLNGTDDKNEDTWEAFQSKVTMDVLTQSGIPLQRCPACDYAEADELPAPRLRSPQAIWRQFVKRSTRAARITSLLCFAGLALAFTLPILSLLLLCCLFLNATPITILPLRKTWLRIYKSRRSPKFKCQSPGCGKVSCMRCSATWRDPHSCFESEKTSLRTAIEASATAAVKRTCPRCMLSFVKESGCNKMVCNCGYTMCYICRQEILSREGYAHFCQHFRPHGGRCTECEKCDLYGDEDEEATIRGAVRAAEKVWRENEGGKEGSGEADAKATSLMIDAVVEQAHERPRYEQWLDAILDTLLT